MLDPRRTETADKADRHLFIRPGTDAVLLLAMINVLFAERLVSSAASPRPATTSCEPPPPRGRPSAPRRSPASPPPTSASSRAPSRPRRVRCSTAASASARRSSAASRRGCATRSTRCTGHLDEPGGLMFTTPAVDPLPLAGMLGSTAASRAGRSRVRGKPEFGGELPVGVLAEEIETAGNGEDKVQIRALLTSAGNPVLSAPGGPRLEKRPRHARLHGLDRSVPQRDHAARARDPAADLAARALALRHRAQRVRRAQHREVLAADVRARPGRAPRLGDLPRAVDAPRRRRRSCRAGASSSASSASSAPRRSSTSRCAPVPTASAAADSRCASCASSRTASISARSSRACPSASRPPIARSTSRPRPTSAICRASRAATRRRPPAAS